ncbi:MAG: glycosyltransferase family 2 protein [Acidobacteria bacterium]|nr:glycosyltransferase family 2 protein [Acidobacteriota bacterium]
MFSLLVSLVTCNDESFLRGCLESLHRQSVPLKIRIFDNASVDRTVEIARSFDAEVHSSAQNRGFSFGHNRNLEKGDFDFCLVLNADTVLYPDCAERLLQALHQVKTAGMSGGKLFRMTTEGRAIIRNGYGVLDSTGIFFTPSQRHFDRGAGEEDRGQYERRQLVFGITGAMMMCRRTMLEELVFEGEYFDEDFFTYREDADLAWRAQLRGWKAVYEPSAVGLHFRKVTPEVRRSLPEAINYHSLKNRYLMRLKNMDAAVRRRCFPYMWFRDLGILAYTLCRERSSLPAYCEIWKLRRKFQTKRRLVQESRRTRPADVAQWFSFQPQAQDL